MAYVSSYRISTATDYYYSVAVSNTNTPTLKNYDGTNFSPTLAIVSLQIDGTGTPDTDQTYLVSYSGSGNWYSYALDTHSPNVSNRPQLYVSGGLFYLRTGHPSNYTTRVHVYKI